MSPDSRLDPLLLDRFLAGLADEGERARVAAWAASHPENAALLDGLRDAFTHTTDTDDTGDTDASWARLASRMQSAPASTDISPFGEARRRQTASRWTRSAWRAAAAILVVVSGAIVWQTNRDHVFEAPRGRQASVTLSDGTRITLAAGSRARWGNDYGHGARDVTLEGEGYFDVVHDTARPFRVRAREGVIEDVGTRFVIRAWPELARVELAVESGAATLADAAQPASAVATVLRAGQLGRLGRDGHVEVSDRVDALLAWTRGELVFDGTPLDNVLPVLARWYDVDLHADPSLASRLVTARFDKLPLPQVLDALALVLDARVKRDGRSITLTPVKK